MLLIYGTIAAVVALCVRSVAPRARIARVTAYCTVVSMIGGQLTEDTRLTYPFVTWNMYAGPVETEVIELRAAHLDGREYPIDLGRYFADEPRTLLNRLALSRSQCECASGDARTDEGLRRLALVVDVNDGVHVMSIQMYERALGGERAGGRILKYTWRQ